MSGLLANCLNPSRAQRNACWWSPLTSGFGSSLRIDDHDPMNVVVAVERRTGNGVAISACQSQMMLAGRVFGSKYSMRWLRSGFFRPVPARFMAPVGVVMMLMIGSFGAFSRGLNARPPSGYCVMRSKGMGRLTQENVYRAGGRDDAAPADGHDEVSATSRAAAVAASTERNVESFSIPANVPAWVSASACSTRASVPVFDAMEETDHEGARRGQALDLRAQRSLNRAFGAVQPPGEAAGVERKTGHVVSSKAFAAGQVKCPYCGGQR